jgi:hypothetical protein
MTFLHTHLIARELLSFFQLDSATGYTANNRLPYLQNILVTTKRKRSWSSRLPALNPCDFFLSDSVRDKFYIYSPGNADDLIGKIQNTVFSVPPSQFRSAFNVLFGVTRDHELKTAKLNTSLKCKR